MKGMMEQIRKLAELALMLVVMAPNGADGNLSAQPDQSHAECPEVTEGLQALTIADWDGDGRTEILAAAEFPDGIARLMVYAIRSEHDHAIQLVDCQPLPIMPSVILALGSKGHRAALWIAAAGQAALYCGSFAREGWGWQALPLPGNFAGMTGNGRDTGLIALADYAGSLLLELEERETLPVPTGRQWRPPGGIVFLSSFDDAWAGIAGKTAFRWYAGEPGPSTTIELPQLPTRAQFAAQNDYGLLVYSSDADVLHVMRGDWRQPLDAWTAEDLPHLSTDKFSTEVAGPNILEAQVGAGPVAWWVMEGNHNGERLHIMGDGGGSEGLEVSPGRALLEARWIRLDGEDRPLILTSHAIAPYLRLHFLDGREFGQEKPSLAAGIHPGSATAERHFPDIGSGAATMQNSIALEPPWQLLVDDRACFRSPVVDSVSPAFVWNPVQHATGYAWEVLKADTAPGRPLASGIATGQAFRVTLPMSLAPGAYRWRVKALGDGVYYSDSPWADACPFVRECRKLSVPYLQKVNAVQCGDLAQLASGTLPTLHWMAVSGAVGYEWEVWTGVGYTGTRVDQGTTTTTHAALSHLLPDGTYQWRARAKGPGEPCDSDWGYPSSDDSAYEFNGCPFTLGTVLCTATSLPGEVQITTDTVWDAAGSPYVTGDITVAHGSTLTLLPGTIVKSGQIIIQGNFIAQGTANAPVIVAGSSAFDVCGPSDGYSNIGPFDMYLEEGSTAQIAGALMVRSYMYISTSGSTIMDQTTFLGGSLTTAMSSAPQITDVNMEWAEMLIIDDSRPAFHNLIWRKVDNYWKDCDLCFNYSNYRPGIPKPSFEQFSIIQEPGARNPGIAIGGWIVDESVSLRDLPLSLGDFSLGIIAGGRLDISNSEITSSQYFGSLWNEGILNLGGLDGPVYLHDLEWEVPGGFITYEPGSSGSISNAIISNRFLLDIKSDIQLMDSVFMDSAFPKIQQEGIAPRFNRVNFLNAGPSIQGNTSPEFETGIWSMDHGGPTECGYPPAGLEYYPGYQPKPVFHHIEMFDRWQVSAFSMAGAITDHVMLSGLNFIPCTSLLIEPQGWLEIKDATLAMSIGGADLSVEGRLDLGGAGHPVSVVNASTGGFGMQERVTFHPGSTGTIDQITCQSLPQQPISLVIETSEPVVVQNSIFSNSEIYIVDGNGSLFYNNQFFQTPIGVGGSASPDFGGGGQGSLGDNYFQFDPDACSDTSAECAAIANVSNALLMARFNRWDCRTTQEMEAGVGNITVLLDDGDRYWMSPIDYSDWLGGTAPVLLHARADRSGSARDVILTWDGAPSGESLVARSAGDPQVFERLGTASGLEYRDSGALDDPSPLLFYRIAGPCVD